MTAMSDISYTMDIFMPITGFKKGNDLTQKITSPFLPRIHYLWNEFLSDSFDIGRLIDRDKICIFLVKRLLIWDMVVPRLLIPHFVLVCRLGTNYTGV